MELMSTGSHTQYANLFHFFCAYTITVFISVVIFTICRSYYIDHSACYFISVVLKQVRLLFKVISIFVIYCVMFKLCL